MRISHPLFADFNPMLTASVFGHLFFLSVLMFLPQSKTIMEKVQPVFMVDLVEIPAGLIDAVSTPVVPAPVSKPAKAEPVEAVPKPVAAKPKPAAPLKPLAPPKPMAPPKAEFSPPPKVAASKSILQELDQVSKLETSRSRPLAKKRKQPLLEETFRELDALKKKPLKSTDPKKSAPLEIDNSLEGFEDLKMKQRLARATPVTPQQEFREELTPEEKKFQQLSQRKVELAAQKNDPVKTTSNLMKELEALEKIKTPPSVTKVNHQSVNKAPKPVVPEIMATLKKKLAALKKKNFTVNIKTKILPVAGSVPEFSSEIRKLKTVKGSQPVKASKMTTRQESTKASPPGTAVNEKSGALAISQYVGLVHVKILENWKDPLGGEGQAQVSFRIFPEGNIDRPALKKSSGVAKLDTLALRAVKLSEPFPPFPKELKRPNLPITVNFDYVSE